MLIPHAASVYARDAEEWRALMSFLKENDCLVGDLRRDPMEVQFDSRLNAIRIEYDKFWKGYAGTYFDCGPDKYCADSEWWCILGYEFIAKHHVDDTKDDGIDASVFELIL